MTDDLVKRLLEPVIDPFFGPLIEPIKKEAADRIEKQAEYIAVYQDQTNIMLTRIEQLEAALRFGVDMREKQKAYFKRRFQDVLLDCKKAERDFDVAARAALGEKKDD